MLSIEQFCAYVRTSEELANIRYEPGAAAFGDHVRTAHAVTQVAADNPPLWPHEIHKKMFFDTDVSAGRYRDTPSSSGLVRTPPPAEQVPELMVRYHRLLEAVMRGNVPKGKEGDTIATIYLLGLCISPFSYGNGRTFRLVMNMLRVRLGLGWYDFKHHDPRYLQRAVARYERTGFPRWCASRGPTT